MANDTGIPWTDVTVNPFPGCRKVSEGCANCYAERMARRLKAMGVPAYQDVVDENGWTGRVGWNLAAMQVPGTGKLVFVQSMGDLFYEGITDNQRDWAFGEMLAQSHTFQILTKRVDNALEYYRHIQGMDFWGLGQTLDGAPNVWFGWTAENQARFDERTPFGLQVPAAVRFLSLEPLLGPIDTAKPVPCWKTDGTRGWQSPLGNGIDWVIVGCESGPNRRPCDPQWVADIVRQCREAAVPVFVKQIGIDGRVVKDPDRIAAALGKQVEDVRQWPKGHRRVTGGAENETGTRSEI